MVKNYAKDQRLEKKIKKSIAKKKKDCIICTRCHGKNVKFFNKTVKTICVGKTWVISDTSKKLKVSEKQVMKRT